jgi:hypothetical protein
MPYTKLLLQRYSSKKTHRISVCLLTMFRKLTFVYSDTHTKPINAGWGKSDYVLNVEADSIMLLVSEPHVTSERIDWIYNGGKQGLILAQIILL